MDKKNLSFLLTFILVFFILISADFSSAASYGSGPYGSGAYGIGYTAPTSTTTSGGGGCSYNWDCTNWFPSECPVSGIQERICANRGTCIGTTGIPNQTQFCVYEHKGPLFDIFLSIYKQFQERCPGEKIKANIRLENYGKVELLDAFMTYWIIDENNKLIFELKDTRNVADKLDFDITLKIPKSSQSGIYRLYAQMTYSGNKTAVAGESFSIMEKDSCKISFGSLVSIILIGLGFLVFIIVVIFLTRKFYYIKKRKRKIKKKKEESVEESYYTSVFKE